MPSRPPILYVNLDRAPNRRRELERRLEDPGLRNGPFRGAELVRIAGVDGAGLRARPEEAAAVLSPHTRCLLEQRSRASAHTQLESWGAVGCYLSHVRCWDWLLGQPPERHGVVLVLEDDACFVRDFAERWWAEVEPLLAVPQQWDVLMLGYFGVNGPTPAVQLAATDGPAVRTLGPGASLFGTHGYLVTRRGAALLRQHAFPLELQVDAFMLILQQIGRLRLYLVGEVGEEGMIRQCGGAAMEASIDHGYVPRRRGGGEGMSGVDDGCGASLLLLLLLLLLVTSVVAGGGYFYYYYSSSSSRHCARDGA